MNKKNYIRNKMIALRKNILFSEKVYASDVITSLCLHRNEIKQAKTICIYVASPDEVDTHTLILQLFKQNKAVIIPKTHDNELTLYRINSLNDLILGSFHIMEPVDSMLKISVSEIDSFIVPGIAFDKKGNRLGWGKGYYDKLLKSISTTKIGLAFSQQILPFLPHEPYDIVMDVVITESEVYENKKNN